MHITEQLGREALKSKIIIPQLFRIHRSKRKALAGYRRWNGVSNPSYLDSGGREAAADDGLHVLSAVDSPVEMGVNFQDRFFPSVKERSQEWKALTFVWPRADKTLSGAF